MRGKTVNKKINNCHTAARQCCSLFAVALCLLLYGCGARQPVMSEAARFFKKEALDTIKRLSPAFTDILAQNNPGTAQPAIDKLISDAGRGGNPKKFKITVLDRNGIKIAGGFRSANEDMNFSSYAAAKKILQQGETASDVLYLQGAQVFIIGAPLVRDGTTVGALVLAVLATDLKDKWQVTEEEFKAISFQ
jgi:hypothetical protein